MFPLFAVYLLLWEKEIEIEEERRKNHLPIFFPIEREELKIGWLIDRRGRWKHICQSIRIRIGKIKTISK
jgi:hypothetical protein